MIFGVLRILGCMQKSYKIELYCQKGGLTMVMLHIFFRMLIKIRLHQFMPLAMKLLKKMIETGRGVMN